MTNQELLSFIKKNNAFMASAADERMLQLANSGLQNISAAIFPLSMTDFYKSFGAIILGGAYIFGPNEIKDISLKYPIPNLFEINNDISSLKQMRAKTVFGRNDLFWFAFDAMGKIFMLDNLTLSPLREYSDINRAVYDCLIIGKL